MGYSRKWKKNSAAHGTNGYKMYRLWIWSHEPEESEEPSHVYVYLCRCGFYSYRLYSVQKHAKTCIPTDNIAYRVDGESFHDWKVFSGRTTNNEPTQHKSTQVLVEAK